METGFHLAIDLAAILLECSVNDSADLRSLNEFDVPFCSLRITGTPDVPDVKGKAL